MIMYGLSGTVYALDKTPIGSGGEGDIYNVGGMGYVAKIYRAGVMTEALEAKLGIMINNPPDPSVLSQVAWPLDLALDGGGKCMGFIMPKLGITHELGDIYRYPSRLPISAQQKINVAQNICVVISEVHKAGYVFGDFNPRNIGLDINTGLVSFLDTDTYHVADPGRDTCHRCNVCAPGYAAPELLEKCSDYVAKNPGASKNAYALTPLPTFTRETDNFALAIHIFKLLMNGYTPFGGILDTASVSQSSPGVGDTAVRRDNYCFKPGYKHQSAAIIPLECFPQEVSDLFTRAFILGKMDPRQRPTAAQWHGALERYEKSLVTCGKNPLHQYDRQNAECPLCEADMRYSSIVGKAAESLRQSTYSPPAEVVQVPKKASVSYPPSTQPVQITIGNTTTSPTKAPSSQPLAASTPGVPSASEHMKSLLISSQPTSASATTADDNALAPGKMLITGASILLILIGFGYLQMSFERAFWFMSSFARGSNPVAEAIAHSPLDVFVTFAVVVISAFQVFVGINGIRFRGDGSKAALLLKWGRICFLAPVFVTWHTFWWGWSGLLFLSMLSVLNTSLFIYGASRNNTHYAAQS